MLLSLACIFTVEKHKGMCWECALIGLKIPYSLILRRVGRLPSSMVFEEAKSESFQTSYFALQTITIKTREKKLSDEWRSKMAGFVEGGQSNLDENVSLSKCLNQWNRGIARTKIQNLISTIILESANHRIELPFCDCRTVECVAWFQLRLKFAIRQLASRISLL